MVKRTQTFRRLLPTNCLRVLEHFVGLVPKELTHGSRKVLTQIRCFNGNIAVLVPHFLLIPASCDEVFY